MSPLPLLRGQQVMSALNRLGYQLVRSRGSHFRFEHPRLKRYVTVAFHAGKTISRDALRSILSQTKMAIEEFMRYVKVF